MLPSLVVEKVRRVAELARQALPMQVQVLVGCRQVAKAPR